MCDHGSRARRPCHTPVPPAILEREKRINMSTENELTRMLWLWLAPRTPERYNGASPIRFLGLTGILSLRLPTSRRPALSGAAQTTTSSALRLPALHLHIPEVPMKRCNACQEEFADKFSFCPVDGSPLNSLAAALVGKEAPGDSYAREFVSVEPPYGHAAAQQPEFKLTMISTAGLWFRLAAEISFVIAQLRRAWPDFKRDPIRVGKRTHH